MNPQNLLAQAMVAHRSGNLADAERFYAAVLAAEPANFDACHGLGLIPSHRAGGKPAQLDIGD